VCVVFVLCVCRCECVCVLWECVCFCDCVGYVWVGVYVGGTVFVFLLVGVFAGLWCV